jgi:uncharacterized RDD family membrane protein YckC
MSPEQICQTYGAWDILVRRWMATWLDLLFLGGAIWGLVVLSGSKPALGGSLGVLFLVLYYPLTEGLTGLTFGKFVCGLRVVDEQGARPGLGKATLRTLCRLVEINPLVLGGVPAGISVYTSPARQRLGDRTARTFVVKAEDLRLLSAPGLPTPPAIHEFSLPLGMSPSTPTPLGMPPPGAFGLPQRLPTHNRWWALPPAGLVTVATVTMIVMAMSATQAEKRARPVVMSCAQFLQAQPKEGWYQLKGCDYHLQDGLYTTLEPDPGSANEPALPESAEARIGDIYVPVFATAENEGRKTPLLVRITDEPTRKLMLELKQLDGAKEPQLTRWLEQHFAELEVHRDLTGTLSSSASLPEPLRTEANNPDSRLSVPYVVLDEGGEPFGWASLGAFGGAFLLGTLTVMFWLNALIVLSTNGGPPPPRSYGIHR